MLKVHISDVSILRSGNAVTTVVTSHSPNEEVAKRVVRDLEIKWLNRFSRFYRENLVTFTRQHTFWGVVFHADEK